MKNPKVSIIIPVYNGEKTLRQCLNSVLNQTYKNYEVIAIDNNSTDKTKEIIKEFQKKYSSIKYIFEKTKGRGAARNTGIRVAKGYIMAMTDSDCIVPQNWIKELTNPIIYENENVVMGFEEDLIKNYWTKNIQKANWKFINENLNEEYASHLDTKNFAVKSSVMKKLMFDSSLGNMEDFDLYLRIKKIARIRFNPLIKVGHNHKSSLINVIKINLDRAYWVAKIYEKHKKNKEYKKEPMFGSISFKSFLLYPLWISAQFIKKPFTQAFFTFVSETSWRIGIIYKLMKK